MSLPSLAIHPVLLNLLQKCACASGVGVDGRLRVTRSDIYSICQAGNYSRAGGAAVRGFEFDHFMTTTGRLFVHEGHTESGEQMFDFDILLCVLEDIHALSFRPDEWHRLKQNLCANVGVARARDARVDGQSDDARGSGGGVDTNLDDLRDVQSSQGQIGPERRNAGSGSISLQLVQRLLATKDAKIKNQAKTLKFYRQRCTRLQKQLDEFRSDTVKTMERESQQTLNITRVKSEKAKKKEVRCLESNKIDEYFSVKKKRLAAKDHIDIDNQEPGRTRRSLGWLTPEGTLSLAIRCNMSNCSAEDLGLVIMDDCSKQTVLRAECRSAAALVASARLFFQQRDSELSDCHDAEERCSFLWLQYREDATNSSKHRSKMTALEVAGLLCRSCPTGPAEIEFQGPNLHKKVGGRTPRSPLRWSCDVGLVQEDA